MLDCAAAGSADRSVAVLASAAAPYMAQRQSRGMKDSWRTGFMGALSWDCRLLLVLVETRWGTVEVEPIDFSGKGWASKWIRFIDEGALLADEGVVGLNQCRTNGDEEERDQNENDEGRDHLDGGFGGLLFGALAAGGAQGIGVNAQGLGDAGAEAVGLDERADQGANVIDAGAVDEIAQGFGAGLAGAHFEVDEMEFVAEIGMGVMQIFADAHQGLIEGESGFDADDGEIESIGQSDADAVLTVFDHALQNESAE